jgi:hypothetical protein
MCIHCLDHFSPCTPPPPSLPLPLASSQNLFCAFLQFCWRVEISNKKDIAFLLVEIRPAIQRDFYHCFHVQKCYNPGLLIFTLFPDPLLMLTSVEDFYINSSGVRTSNAFRFWVFYLTPYLPYMFSPCHVAQILQHCCICPKSKVCIW